MSKPQRIFLLRHGQSVGNVDRMTHATVPDWKIPLTDLGREQAKAAGRELREQVTGPLAVYESPYLRTKHTTDEVLRSFGPDQVERRREDPRLREQEWGNLRAFEPKPWSEIEEERDAYGPFFFRFNSGESGADVFDRCTGFLSTLYRDFENPDFPATCLITTHGFTLRVLLMRWLHWTVEEFHALGNPPNGARFELRRGSEGKYRLVTPFPPKRP